MPKQKRNIVMQTTTGMFGGQVVFKQRAGKNYVSAPPLVDKDRVPTAAQLVVREKFGNNSEYAAEAMGDEALKALYEAAATDGSTAYNVAFRDAHHAPVVSDLIEENYSGVPGNILIVKAKDDFKVTGVKFMITNANGQLIEEGAAVAKTKKATLWLYTVTQANANIAGTKITIIATDIPGNKGTLEVTL